MVIALLSPLEGHFYLRLQRSYHTATTPSFAFD
jgi:hypothetical protein